MNDALRARENSNLLSQHNGYIFILPHVRPFLPLIQNRRDSMFLPEIGCVMNTERCNYMGIIVKLEAFEILLNFVYVI